MQNVLKNMVELETVWVQLLLFYAVLITRCTHMCSKFNLKISFNALENSRINYEHLSSSKFTFPSNFL